MKKNNLITFKTEIQKEGAFTFMAIPFSPRAVWGAKPRYNVTGTINGFAVRGCLGALKQNYFLRLSTTWLRESGINVGDEVSVKLEPEEAREIKLAADIAKALSQNKNAQALFNALPPSHQKKYIQWIESAKREGTRAKRIDELSSLLEKKKREK
jgi:hypothetical protein